jgi:Rhodopirellula transposase DDE domain
MQYETAGDPMTGLKWTRRTTAKIARELQLLGIVVSDRTVAKLLKQMDYSLRVNHKKLSNGSSEQRDAQFARIASLREQCAAEGLPLISVDTKKKELVGQFKNPGAAWRDQPVQVNDHDFRSQAEGLAVPYGIYDVLANRGTVFVGTSHDTPEFAVDSIATWWRYEGQRRYHRAQRITILADSGGSNGANCRAWKYGLQRKLCERHRLVVTVAHYPSGASKWNPIEHRLFSEISKNWAGRPLDSYETILNYIRSTRTVTGLCLRAYLVRKQYQKGVKIPDPVMRQLPITKDPEFPKWNYTLCPS